MATSNIICRYHKAGVCANGRRCKFSHELDNPELSRKPGSIPIQCRYYKEKSCTLGNRCAYLHGQRRAQPPITRVAPPSAVQHIPAAATLNTDIIEPQPPARREQAPVDAIWGFEDDGQHGDGYFYGAPGGFVDEFEASAFSYRDAVGLSGAEDNRNNEPAAAEAPRRVKTDRLCIYHAQGVCRFGVLCRNLHDIPPDLLDNPERTPEEKLALDEEERELSATAECGICYAPVKEQFGLLNNCSHAFCLSCMREWRTKGREQVHKEIVRQCPICRVESFVVIPSARLVVDTVRKSKLVDMYKSTLSSIKCKYFEYGQSSCPFGSSCFYAHLMPDGSAAEAPKLRYAVGEAGTRIVSTPSIMDLLA